MYELIIDDHGHDVSTLHDTPAAARAVLHAYLVQSDYYQRPTQLDATHATFDLLALTENAPRVVGGATIAPYTDLDADRDIALALAAHPALAHAS